MMKFFLLLILCLASNAFADICRVNMVDIRTHYIIRTFSSYDRNDACKEAMKECRKQIRLEGRYGLADCKIVSPTPSPGQDAQRQINYGERVVMNNTFQTVIAISWYGLYTVQAGDAWRTVTPNVRRESLSVTSGCNFDLCVNDSIIVIRTARFAHVAGLSYDGRFILKHNDAWNTLESNVERTAVAKTKGCVYGRYQQLCVGNMVIDHFNRYSTVVGIQMDGKVVIKLNDAWNTLMVNINPADLVIVR